MAGTQRACVGMGTKLGALGKSGMCSKPLSCNLMAPSNGPLLMALLSLWRGANSCLGECVIPSPHWLHLAGGMLAQVADSCSESTSCENSCTLPLGCITLACFLPLPGGTLTKQDSKCLLPNWEKMCLKEAKCLSGRTACGCLRGS